MEMRSSAVLGLSTSSFDFEGRQKLFPACDLEIFNHLKCIPRGFLPPSSICFLRFCLLSPLL